MREGPHDQSLPEKRRFVAHGRHSDWVIGERQMPSVPLEISVASLDRRNRRSLTRLRYGRARSRCRLNSVFHDDLRFAAPKHSTSAISRVSWMSQYSEHGTACVQRDVRPVVARAQRSVRCVRVPQLQKDCFINERRPFPQRATEPTTTTVVVHCRPIQCVIGGRTWLAPFGKGQPLDRESTAVLTAKSTVSPRWNWPC